jgi:outer membrane lipoprotein-sorting protein
MPGSITTAAAVFFFLPLAAVFLSGCAHAGGPLTTPDLASATPSTPQQIIASSVK